MADSVYDAIKEYLERPEVQALLADPAGSHTIPPIAFENGNFTPPNPPAPWVRMSVTGQLYGQESIGAGDQADNRWDEEGKLYLVVFVRIGSGASRSHGLARQLANLFRGRTLMDGALEFQDAFIGEGGKSEPEDGNWYQRNVVIDWRRTEAN